MRGKKRQMARATVRRIPTILALLARVVRIAALALPNVLSSHVSRDQYCRGPSRCGVFRGHAVGPSTTEWFRRADDHDNPLAVPGAQSRAERRTPSRCPACDDAQWLILNGMTLNPFLAHFAGANGQNTGETARGVIAGV